MRPTTGPSLPGHNKARHSSRGLRPSATGGNEATNGKALPKRPLIKGLSTTGHDKARRHQEARENTFITNKLATP